VKYILILYVCSYVTAETKCNDERITGSFDNWSSCINQGYQQSHFLLNELYQEDFEDEKLAIRFSCEEQGEKT
jgi:uncharacterized protein YecT (DUF1311 family)